MKRIYKYIYFLLFLLVVTTRVEALSVSKNNLNMDALGNENVELYANVVNATKVEFTLVYSTYDIPVEFIINSKFKNETPGGIKHTIIFDEVKNGKVLLGTININVIDNPHDLSGTVTINKAKYINNNNEVINLDSQIINIKVNQKEEDNKKIEIDNNLLDKIESKIVNINLKKDIYTYDITIDDNIHELDLKAIPKDNNTSIFIDTQKISELKDNKIIIKTKYNDIEQDYIINVKINKKEKNMVMKIDNTIFSPDISYKSKWKTILIISGIIFVICLPFSFRKKHMKGIYK